MGAVGADIGEMFVFLLDKEEAASVLEESLSHSMRHVSPLWNLARFAVSPLQFFFL